MTTTKPAKGETAEIILTKPEVGTVQALYVHQTGATNVVDVTTISMRGAQREMTGWMIGRGFEPIGRWETLDAAGDETSRAFRYTGGEK